MPSLEQRNRGYRLVLRFACGEIGRTLKVHCGKPIRRNRTPLKPKGVQISE